MADQSDAKVLGDGSPQLVAAAPAPSPGGAAAVGTPPMVINTPAYKWEPPEDLTDNFNLCALPDCLSPVPEDQRKIAHDVYEARNVLVLVKEHDAIKKSYDEFIKRVIQAGTVGCVARPYVHPINAAAALEQIRADIVRRVGMPLVYRYLAVLAACAVGGLLAGIAAGHLIGFAAAFLGHPVWPAIHGYDWILVGAMAGAWFLVAVSRWQIAFDTIADYVDIQLEPVIRMLFVALVAAVFALFLHLSIVKITIGDVDLASFDNSISVALLVGFVAGISQRALSVQLIERAQKVLNPG